MPASVVGLLLSLGTLVLQWFLCLVKWIKGKMMNAAFSVNWTYVLGGQLGFISSVADSHGIMIYIN